MRRKQPAPWSAVVITAVLSMATFVGLASRSTSDPAGEQAMAIKTVWDAMLVVCGVMYVLVLGFLAWAIWRTGAGCSGEVSKAMWGH